MKTKWAKTLPQEDGWYWVKYRGKHGMKIAPASVLHFKMSPCVHTADNTFFAWDDLKKVKFGPKIKVPQ